MSLWIAFFFFLKNLLGFKHRKQISLNILRKCKGKESCKRKQIFTGIYIFCFKFSDEESGFLFLQYKINKAFMFQCNAPSSIEKTTNLVMKRIMYPPFTTDALSTGLEILFPFVLMISFILSVLMMAKNLAFEKERNLKVSSSYAVCFICCPFVPFYFHLLFT